MATYSTVNDRATHGSKTPVWPSEVPIESPHPLLFTNRFKPSEGQMVKEAWGRYHGNGSRNTLTHQQSIFNILHSTEPLLEIPQPSRCLSASSATMTDLCADIYRSLALTTDIIG
jgi:hypothetical protein